MSRLVFIYNINRITNKICKISKVVNIILKYKTYIKQTLFVVLSFGKQNLIFRFI